MESNTQSPPRENSDAKATATFRKPTNDAGSRKYRRRSPVGESSSSEESPTCERFSSPPATRKDREKGPDDRRRKDGRHDQDRDSVRSQYGRDGDSFRHSERRSSRSSRGYHRHDNYHHRYDDYRRPERYADDADRDYSRSSRHSHHTRKETEYHPRDNGRDYGKYSQDKTESFGDRSRDRGKENVSRECQKPKEKDLSSDRAGSGRRHGSSTSEDIRDEEGEIYKEDKMDTEEKIVHKRRSRDYKTDYSPAYEDPRSHRNDSTPMRDHPGDRHKETKSLEDGKYGKQAKRNSDEMDMLNERYEREAEEQVVGRKRYYSKDQNSTAKNPKLFGSNGSNGDGTDVMEEKAVSVLNQSTNPKPAQEPSGKGTSEQVGLTDSDIDAAKLAAMKAAESVNRNLIGTGCLSADQKKKLLWGNKKTAATEESGHRWETTHFGDRERQEKFHKLMGVKGDIKAENKLDDNKTEMQREQLELDLEKQYTAGLRRRDGRTVGLGL